MLFSSFAFIFIFLPLVWIIFHALKRAHFRHHYAFAKIFLIISSLFFYAFWKVAYLPILLGSIIINYALAKMILRKTTIGGGDLDNNFAESALDSANHTKNAESKKTISPNSKIVDEFSHLCEASDADRTQGSSRKRALRKCEKSPQAEFAPKFYFIAGIIFNLSLLAFFKYTDFLLENFNAFSKLAHLDFNIPLPHILLPLALSFVTFQQIAFLFDCFKRAKGELSEELNIDFIDYALFISFFPQLIAGPIVHHREMMPQFSALNGANSASFCDKSGRLATRFGDELNVLSSRSWLRNPNFSSKILEFTSCVENAESSEKIAEYSPDSATRTKIAESNKKNKFKKPIKKFLLLFAFAKRRILSNHHDSNPPSKVDSQNLGAESTTKSIINYEFLAKGIFIFSIGLFKKVFIADSFAKWANAGFSIVEKGGFLNLAESWATSLSYTFQLYFDFSGYCDMAMGLALMFGITLPLNFSSPYKSLNIAEFWRRWHRTLGRFLRECLYIPLGGNRIRKILILRNLFIVAFLSGLWHGAGWGFVIWGILHGSAMVIHRIYSWLFESVRFVGFTQTRFYKILCWLLTFNFVNLAWVFFRAENLNGAVNLIKGMFGFSKVEMTHHYSKFFSAINAQSNEILIWLICAFILCLACKNAFEMLQTFKVPYFRFCASLQIFNKTLFIKCGAIFARFVLALALFYISIWIMFSNLISANTYTPFLYFNF